MAKLATYDVDYDMILFNVRSSSRMGMIHLKGGDEGTKNYAISIYEYIWVRHTYIYVYILYFVEGTAKL